MGFFDNVKSSLTETSQDLTKKAKDTTEIYRLNNANKTKEKEIEKVIYQIGLRYFDNYREECREKCPELVGRIEQLQMEIAANKQMVEQLSIVVRTVARSWIRMQSSAYIAAQRSTAVKHRLRRCPERYVLHVAHRWKRMQHSVQTAAHRYRTNVKKTFLKKISKI